MNGDDSDLIDWRQEWLQSHTGHHVAILIPVDGELFDGEGESLEEQIELELKELLNTPTVGVSGVDPYTGAGGYGIAAIWEIIGHGADLLAYIGAAVAVAPKIRESIRFLTKRLNRDGSRDVALSAEAIKALCVAEICDTGVSPDSISRVQIIEHKYRPGEPTIEKQQFFSAYTVTVEGAQPDGFYHVWSTLVTCRGDIVSSGSVRIPIPNGTQWYQVMLTGEKLRGLN